MGSLERATSRLESLASSSEDKEHLDEDKAAQPASNENPKTSYTILKPQQNDQAASAHSVASYKDLIGTSLPTFLKLSSQLGGVINKQVMYSKSRLYIIQVCQP